MANKTQEKLRYRRLASFLLVMGFVVLFLVVTPNQEASFLRNAGMVAAFLLFPASVYFNFKAREEHAFDIPRRQLVIVLLAFLGLMAGMVWFN